MVDDVDDAVAVGAVVAVVAVGGGVDVASVCGYSYKI